MAEKDCPATGVTGPGWPLRPCSPRVARGIRAQLLHAWFRAICTSFCAPSGGGVAEADDDEMGGLREATETPPVQKKGEEVHCSINGTIPGVWGGR